MEQGQDPDDYTFKLREVRGRLYEMGEKISDERFEDILLQGLTDDYEFVKMTSFHSPNFGITDIQSMMRNLNIDRLSKPGNVNKIAGKGVAMATTEKPRKVRCYNCEEIARIKPDCTNSNQEPPTSKWCSLHNTTKHSDAECKAHKSKEDTNTPPQGEVHIAHKMTVSTPTEEDFVFFAFATSSPASHWTADVMPKPQPVSHIDIWMNLLHFLLSALNIFVGVWELLHQGFRGVGASGHYFDDELHPDLKDERPNYKELQRPDEIVIAGRHSFY